MLLTLQTKKGISGGGGGNTYATWNPADKSANITLSNGNLTAANTTSASWSSVRATISKSSGKWVFEVTKVGLYSQSLFGFGDINFSLASYVGATSASASYFSANYFGTGITTVGTPPATGVGAYMIALDLDAGKGWIAKAGVWANTGNPAAGTNPSFTFTPNMVLYPACAANNTEVETLVLNAGASAFNNTVPSGFNSGWYN